MSENYFIDPFAISGDRATVPVATQTDGSVSYVTGYTSAYSVDPATDPDALNIERTKFNQLIYQITKALQELQQCGGSAPWISASDNGGVAFPYSKNARVLYSDGNVYESLQDANTFNPTNPTYWRLVNLAQYATINNTVMTGTANAQALNVAGNRALTTADITTVYGGASPEDWRYTLFPDGTMQVIGVCQISTNYGSAGQYYEKAITWPIPFLSGTAPYVLVSECRGYTTLAESGEKVAYTRAETIAGATICLLRLYGTGGASDVTNVIYTATGRWK